MSRRWSRAFLAIALVTAGTAGRAEEAGAIQYQDAVLVQLAVTDLDRALRFYTEVLEMELELRNDDLGWARVRPGLAGFTIGLGRQEKVAGSGTISINLGVARLDEVRSALEARGVVFDGPTQEIPGVVRLAGFRDPDGNWIRLAGAPSPAQSP